MPRNKNAMLRYRTIDQCLKNRFRQWTLADLMEACAEALYEHDGKHREVSRRTLQSDLNVLRTEFEAPIIVVDKKYYTYEDPNFSITKTPLNQEDLSRLNEAIDILQQFQGFNHFRDMEAVVKKLEDKVRMASFKKAPIIDLEKNEDLKGLHHLNRLYRAIQNRQTLQITYQSFKAKESRSFVFHPYLLKEYRNRWFLVGKRNRESQVSLLALDRMHEVEKSDHEFKPHFDFDPESFFDEVIGVTVIGTPAEEVILKIDRVHAPYVITKPIHASQEVLEEDEEGVTISLRVKWNYELEREILGFGEAVKVLAPARLKKKIALRLEESLKRYQ